MSELAIAPPVILQETPLEEIEKSVKEMLGPLKSPNALSKLFKGLSDKIENPSSIPLSTYKRMWEGDETIQTGIEFIALSGMGMMGEYYHPKKSIQKFIRRQIANMKETWFSAIEDIISDGCAYGYAVSQVCLVNNDGQVELSRIVGMSPVGGRFRFDNNPKSRNYLDVVSFIPSSDLFGIVTADEEIPIERCVHWAHRSRYGNPFGTSRLRSSFKNYIIKDQMFKAWAVTMERCGSPLSWIKTKNGNTKIVVGGEEMTRREHYLAILEDLQNTTGFVIDDGEEVGNAQVPRSISSDFEKILNYCNSMMYRSLLVPTLLFDTAEIGSNALAKQHFQVYIMSMNRMMKTIAPIIVRSVIRPLVYANFGKQRDYGSFDVKELSEDNAKLVSDIFYSLTTSGYLSPELRADMDMVRKKFNIHQLSDEEFDELEKIRKEKEVAAKAPAVDPSSAPSPGGRKGNPGGPQPEKPGTRPAPKAPATKQGRPKK